jgi:hypothetical protein
VDLRQIRPQDHILKLNINFKIARKMHEKYNTFSHSANQQVSQATI